jgi:hypothetical protein
VLAVHVIYTNCLVTSKVCWQRIWRGKHGRIRSSRRAAYLARKYIFERDRARLKIACFHEIDNGKSEELKGKKLHTNELVSSRKAYGKQVVSDHFKHNSHFLQDEVRWITPKFSTHHFGKTEKEPVGPPNGFRIVKTKLPEDRASCLGVENPGKEWIGIPIMTVPSEPKNKKLSETFRLKNGSLVRKRLFLDYSKSVNSSLLNQSKVIDAAEFHSTENMVEARRNYNDCPKKPHQLLNACHKAKVRPLEHKLLHG